LVVPSNPDFREVVESKFQLNRFAHFLGFELTQVEPGFIEGKLRVEDHHRQQDGWAHGGLLMSLCDIVAGLAAYTLVDKGQRVVTAEIKVSCLRPGRGQVLIARGTVLKPGKRFHFSESEVWSVEEEETVLAAKGTTTMAVIQ
jgi:uncharacterized protein (TIGR00369 family)